MNQDRSGNMVIPGWAVYLLSGGISLLLIVSGFAFPWVMQSTADMAAIKVQIINGQAGREALAQRLESMHKEINDQFREQRETNERRFDRIEKVIFSNDKNQ